MRRLYRHAILAVAVVLYPVAAWQGWATGSRWLSVFAALGACYLCYLVGRMVHGRRSENNRPTEQSPTAAARPARPQAREPVNPHDTGALIEQMLLQDRFALLLREQLVGNLEEHQFRRALHSLEETMALVPDGEVVLGRIDDALEDGKLDADEIVAARGRVIRVERFFLDRFPVTNRQFYEFVSSGGYQQTSLWESSMLPAVLDFVDRSGMPGPRYWREGCFLAGEENHPVVGVSWYEAMAYARWLGKRLPSDAEWVKAGSWPVPISPTTREQRRYPWGDGMDRSRANLWGSGPTHIVPVEDFTEGVSVGGVYQLIGNVWEWTAGNYRGLDYGDGSLELPAPMKSIRGGAFDTYFDNQATCQFQSGENPLHRRHNIGFRCAVGVCDLMLCRPVPTDEEPANVSADVEPQQHAAEQADPQAEEVHA